MKNIGEKELALRQEICEVAHRMYLSLIHI